MRTRRADESEGAGPKPDDHLLAQTRVRNKSEIRKQTACLRFRPQTHRSGQSTRRSWGSSGALEHRNEAQASWPPAKAKASGTASADSTVRLGEWSRPLRKGRGARLKRCRAGGHPRRRPSAHAKTDSVASLVPTSRANQSCCDATALTRSMWSSLKGPTRWVRPARAGPPRLATGPVGPKATETAATVRGTGGRPCGAWRYGKPSE